LSHAEEKRHTARTIALCAQKALLYEVSATPKPGLVDRAGSGAHRDMDLFSFLDSACALLPYFECCAQTGLDAGKKDAASLLPRLREEGLKAEETMLRATGGVNTHKGAIFLLGLLTASAGCCQCEGSICEDDILETAARIARPALDDFADASLTPTAGLEQHRRYGTAGIRGEAAAGFPSVGKTALPLIRNARKEGRSLNDAGVEALLALILKTEDSTLIKRCGSPEAAEKEREKLRALLKELPPVEAAARLDADWSARGISAGGCADLLGAAYFLLFLEEGTEK